MYSQLPLKVKVQRLSDGMSGRNARAGLLVIRDFLENDFALQAGLSLVSLRSSVAMRHPPPDGSSR